MHEKAIDDFSKAISLAVLPQRDLWLPEKQSVVPPDKTNSNLVSLYLNRSWDYQRLKKYRESASDYARAVELDPTNAEGFFALAWCYDALGVPKEAIKNYSQTIRLNPKYAHAYINRASSYGELKNYQAAIDDCTKAIALEPKEGSDYAMRSYYYSKLGKSAEAAKDDAMTKKLVLKTRLIRRLCTSLALWSSWKLNYLRGLTRNPRLEKFGTAFFTD